MALKGKRPTQNSQNQGSNLPNNAGLEQKRVNTQPQTTTAQNTPYN
ncbi:MAG: hypothetical protein H9W80_12365 [Enterococcus sp.]|nr:hypothetical protein [Enterococcus sp.]